MRDPEVNLLLNKEATKRTLLLCTGKTEWDELGRVVGDVNVPLSPAGEEHAEKTHDIIGEIAPSVVFVGPSLACRETALISLRGYGAKIKVAPELKDLNWGHWQGMKLQGIKERFKRSYAQWIKDPHSIAPPNGEALQDMEERLDFFIEKRLSGKSQTSVGIIATPMVIAGLKIQLIESPWESFWDMISAPQSVELIEYTL